MMTEDDERRGIDAEPRGLTLVIASLLGHILGMAVCAAAGVWLVAEALGAPGPAWSRLAFGAAGVLLAVGGLGLGISGIRRFVAWVRSDGYARRLEHRARKLGLPTDPEAYQDGGLAVAATAGTPQEAEVLAITLRSAGIPAWVPDRETVAWDWLLQNAIRPDGMRVVVPLGRLEEARQVLAGREHQSPLPDEEESVGSSARRSLAGILWLLFAVPVLLLAVFLTWHLARGWGPDVSGGIAFALFWAAGLGGLVLGIRALCSSSKQQGVDGEGKNA